MLKDCHTFYQFERLWRVILRIYRYNVQRYSGREHVKAEV
jgi:hypothetical protein